MQDWLRLFDAALADLEGDRFKLALEEVLAAARTGTLNQVVTSWMDDTAVSHLIAWNIADVFRSDVRPQDCIVRGGREATVWIFERFAHTYLTEWSPSSISWELSYISQPIAVAAGAGINPAILGEREVESDALIAELVTRNSAASVEAGRRSFAGIDILEVLEQIVHLARANDLVQAQSLARESSKKFPTDPHIRNAFAFLLVATDPFHAAELLTDTELERLNPLINSINHASCLLAQGKRTECLMLLEALQVTEDDTRSGWLWAPESLMRDQAPELRYYAVTEWISAARTVAI
ncbi:hypothetical protein [Cryobacterium sp. TMT4-31]|uniref:hypothetical protein n=1 Tax=Cryobacterium sp. TMT4-31 TaxID=1259259 RepID=UPI00106C6798|nr:hypothetical protein [Cryobacterium sp. TMT4-31]TFC92602.1 hypothetical protein E3T19_01315 [Cryobacterium sp. TMT4-31]